MKNLTGSALPIFKHCGYSFRDDVEFPSLRTERDESEGGAGVSIHELIADAIERKSPPAETEEWAIIQAALDQIGNDSILDHESAWAWNTKTRQARKLGTRIGRAYAEKGATAEDICCSLDLVLLREPDLVVVDFKSGYGTHTENVDENWQLLFGALCLEQEALDRGLNLRVELWYPRPGKVWVETHPVTLFHLAAMREALGQRLLKLSQAPAIAGEHCRYCRACGACPATQQAITGFSAMGLDVDSPTYRWSTQIADVRHAEWMLDRLGLVKQAAELVETALKKFSDENNGIATSDGKVWRKTVGKRTGLNMPAVKNFLGDKLGQFQTTHEFNSYRKVKA